jgi:HlyD family secretion protein
MTREKRKRLILGAVGALILAALVYGFIPDPIAVQTETVASDSLQVVIEEEGETRVEDVYVVSSPVAAYVRRIELSEGDLVQAGQPVAQLESPRAPILDPRTREEAAARVQSARAGLAQAEAVAAQAVNDRDRLERLAALGSATPQSFEQAAAEAERAVASREAARAELAAAQASLRAADGAGQSVQEVVRAPASGRVLAVHHRSSGHVNAGEVLLELGDTKLLQVAVDVLSQDAVRIGPGTRVVIDQWGGEAELEGVVDRVEPRGFTRVSALGVEERRVTVWVDLPSPPTSLGPGYRVLARFVVWDVPVALQIPTSALFRYEDGWAVFVVESGRARRRMVEVGQQAGLTTEILDGLTEGEEVIVHPGNEIEDGARVTS